MFPEKTSPMELILTILRRTAGGEIAEQLQGRNVESIIAHLGTELRRTQDELAEIRRQAGEAGPASHPLQGSMDHLRFFNALATATWAADSLPAAGTLFLELLKRCAPYEHVAHFAVDLDSHEFRLSQPEALAPKFSTAVNNILDTGMFAWALREDKPAMLAIDGSDVGLMPGLATLAVVPMVVAREPVGVVSVVYALPPERLSPQTVAMVQGLVKNYGIFLSKLRQQETLKAGLQAAENRRVLLEDVVNSFIQGMFSLDKNGRIVVVNRTAEIVFAKTRQEMLGHAVGEVFEPAVAAVFQRLREQAEAGEPLPDYEIDYRSSMHAVFSLGVTCSLVRDEHGECIGTVFLFRDLFSAKEMLRLEESDRTKSRSIERANRDIEQIRRQLVQADKLASMGRLAAGVAHEINNPLSTVSGYIQIMMLDLDEAAQSKYCLHIIHEELKRIKRIVRNLLDFSRQRADPGNAWARLDVAALLRQTLEFVGNQAKVEGVEILPDLPAEPVWVYANPDELKQVFLNILFNAMQAMHGRPRRQLSVHVRQEAATDIDEAAKRPVVMMDQVAVPAGEWTEGLRPEATPATVPVMRRGQLVAAMTFEDSGEGIRQEDLGRIFDPFFTTKAPGEGTGLGLSTSYGIIERHGGRIAVRSRWGEGSSFTIKLPIVEPGTA